jgi:hypothetical protein
METAQTALQLSRYFDANGCFLCCLGRFAQLFVQIAPMRSFFAAA